PADQVAIALLQRDDRPAEISENLPIPDAFGIGAAARSSLIAGIEWRARGDAARLAIEPGEAPTLAAEPADILVGVAPAGEFPIEDASQRGALQQVISGAEIAVAQHRAKRRRDVGFEPARRPFEDRPRVRVQVEIGAEAGDLRRRTVLLPSIEEGEVGPRRPDRLKARQLLAEAIRYLRQTRLERRIGGDLATLRGSGAAPHDKKPLLDG